MPTDPTLDSPLLEALALLSDLLSKDVPLGHQLGATIHRLGDLLGVALHASTELLEPAQRGGRALQRARQVEVCQRVLLMGTHREVNTSPCPQARKPP